MIAFAIAGWLAMCGLCVVLVRANRRRPSDRDAPPPPPRVAPPKQAKRMSLREFRKLKASRSKT